ncbi:aspartate carbamoyltransferase [Tumebacillus flagellatus]|uniref:Aspartate carbamoyltransferase n=1 Tax=Tumebacillus flagellatus TaxID=1157490 RepID=A0A074M7S7_9BACL|nr:aspartate carbamoyltransferase [Tumebacillus flagellatus]KEO82037.1 aspartate carbamoyltransferase [Tumebacillus flagellatus]
MYHVLSAHQFDRQQLDELFKTAEIMEFNARKGGLNLLGGKIMAALFFEPSTRTRFSFESAMMRLGGTVISTENAAQFSSAIKGETLEDSIRVISSYADVIVMRHNEVGAAMRAAKVATVPVINAGDGAGEHPTQSLLDLYTIQKELGRVDGLKVAMVGDLTYGRTVHSLAYLLAKYQGVKLYFVAPESCPIPEKVKAFLDEKGVEYFEETDLEKVAEIVDVLYMTRIQKERFPTQSDYERAAGVYKIDPPLLDRMKSNSIILHPLPRAGEIAPEVDDDPRAAYFRQAKNGVYIRMALLAYCLEEGMVSRDTTALESLLK